jgi:hypothetical protein
MMQFVYSLELFAGKCIVEVTANGLLLFRADAKHGVGKSYPFNTELVGNGNQVVITTIPTLLDSGTISTTKDIIIKGTLKKYKTGETTGPECGELITTIDFTNDITVKEAQAATPADLVKIFPLSQTITFDNEGVSFKNRLIDAPKISDKTILLDYAEKLRDILARKDLDALYKEYKPKLDDYVLAYPQEFPAPREWFDNLFGNDFFPGEPITDFKRDKIGLRTWCEGRIWEIFIAPAQPLFQTRGANGFISSIEVFVGLVDNNLKIIR